MPIIDDINNIFKDITLIPLAMELIDTVPLELPDYTHTNIKGKERSLITLIIFTTYVVLQYSVHSLGDTMVTHLLIGMEVSRLILRIFL
jgi:hypothetical protein